MLGWEATVKTDRARRLTRNDQWFRHWMPYCFKKLEVRGRNHVYLPVNRDYKPLGITSKEDVDYDAYLSQAVMFSVDPHEFDNIWFDKESLHLYEDVASSRVDYFERLERLLSQEVRLYSKSN